MITKKIEKKNYIIVAVVSLLVVLFSFYIRTVYLNNTNTTKSVFEKGETSSIHVGDINYVVSEYSDILIFISHTKTVESRALEKKYYKEIVKKNLTNKVIYLNINEYLENDEYKKVLSDNVEGLTLESVPAIVYVNNAEVVSVYDDLTLKSLSEIIEKNDIN